MILAMGYPPSPVSQDDDHIIRVLPHLCSMLSFPPPRNNSWTSQLSWPCSPRFHGASCRISSVLFALSVNHSADLRCSPYVPRSSVGAPATFQALVSVPLEPWVLPLQRPLRGLVCFSLYPTHGFPGAPLASAPGESTFAVGHLH